MKRFAALCCLLLCLAAMLPLSGCAGSSTSESTGEYVDDAIITTKVKAALAGDKVVSLLDITVETFKGVVQLSGFVNTREQSEEAVKVASAITGVKAVKDSLIVKGK